MEVDYLAILGEVGFEPTNVGVRVRDLNRLATLHYFISFLIFYKYYNIYFLKNQIFLLVAEMGLEPMIFTL